MGRFNLIQPSLIQQLKTILDQYQDDGQILKELIQNAEDAGASNVKFLYDEHSHANNPKKMHHPDLAEFQGPALYAYNDAVFTDEDWVGLKMLSDSVKKNDPMKVGRFGLGFKSVFHMTDIPTVISGNTIGVIDPHEKYFQEDGYRTTGYMWHLREDKEEIRKIPDQFAPFRDIFDCSQRTFDSGSYRGTLFRFPLRQIASKLCDTLYSSDKIDGLFSCFQRIAHLIPLFLSSVECVEVFERTAKEREPRLRFKVCLSKRCLAQVRSKRRDFIEKVRKVQKKPETVLASFPITIETVTYEGSSQTTQTETYLVTRCFKGGKFSDEMKEIMCNSDLTFTPRVGVAVRIPDQKQEEDLNEEPTGHVFCFLPLPLHKRSQTGLPCHVNGFFAVSQNRQFLKWPTTDQGAEKLVLDKACIWNQCVLREIVPDVYAELLLQVITGIKQGTLQTISPMQFYDMIPDVNQVDEKWKLILKPFFELLLSKPLLYTPLKKGQWLKIDSAIINSSSSDQTVMHKIVVDTLLLANENVALIPLHIESAINLYWGSNYTSVTPSFLREVLKKFSKYKQYGWRDKLSLLLYALGDEDYTTLDGLELLPLADGSFTKFSKNERSVFIPNEDHPMSILPGLEKHFLHTSLESGIYDRITCLDCMDSTQIKHFDKETVLELLPEMFPQEWGSKQVAIWAPDANPNHPPEAWMETFWTYAKENFSENISLLEDFHLVPYTRDEKTRITKLKTDSPKILRITEGASIDTSIAQILRTLGVIVVEVLPDYLKEISTSLYEYILPPTVSSVVNVLKQIAHATSLDSLNEMLLCKVDPDGRKSLRKFLSRIDTHELDDSAKDTMYSLPLFSTVSSSNQPSRFVSVNDVSSAAPREVSVLPPGVSLLDVSDDDSYDFAKTLGVRLLTMTEYLCEILFPMIKTGGVFKPSEVSCTMIIVLKNLSLYKEQDPNFGHHIREIPFIKRSDGLVVCPGEVFDPGNPVLQALFAKENVFPASEFCTPQILTPLRSVGLKGTDEICAADITKTALCIQNLSSSATTRREKNGRSVIAGKSNALAGILCERLILLDEIHDGQRLCELLMDIDWMLTDSSPPSGYPKKVKWFEGEMFVEKPKVIKSATYASVIGSVLPTVDCKSFEPLHSVFGWDDPPSETDIVRHLKNVACSYSPDVKAGFMVITGHIYDALAERDPSVVRKALTDCDVTDWIWHGDGFVKTSRIIVERAFIDLRPYLYYVPSETECHVELFKNCGVEEVLTDVMQIEILHNVKLKYDAPRSKHSRNDVVNDLHIVSSIVNRFGSAAGETSPEIIQQLLLPVHTDSDTKLELSSITDCTYCDAEWLKDRHNSGENEINFVHQSIPNHVAEALGVPSLMSRMLDTDDFEIGEGFGQSEPLTTRLHTLLQDYKDGFAVPKELIQNADDAGATEVKFLYDERQNEDCRTCLIDEGMRECQGPALWAYNNAVFTDKDFESIIKLSGATKEKETEKIGGFGLGFNAVYNLTDVPSFLSRHYLVIFDPHIFHLGKGISDATKPGIKIDMAKNRKCLTSLGNQFKPYQGVFGCNVQPHGSDACASFDGTLFRFPLRTKEQALKSAISSLFYDRKNVLELLQLLAKGIDSMLLFTQNVSKVSVYHLPSHAKSTEHAECLFSVTKSPHAIVKRHTIPIKLSDVVMRLPEDQQDFFRQSNSLKACSAKLRSHSSRLADEDMKTDSSIILQLHCLTTDYCKQLFNANVVNAGKRLWLVSSVMGDGPALKMALYEEGLIPAAGIAVPLSQVSETRYIPVQLNDGGGSVFCFLPLPIYSGVGVHVNGAFAVTSNRRQLCERLRDDKRDVRADWNDVLMEDAVSKAFVALLCDLKRLADHDEYHFYSLWPRSLESGGKTGKQISTSFYKKICCETSRPEIFARGRQWVSIVESVFLHPELTNSPISDDAIELLNSTVKSKGLLAIDIPSQYTDAMSSSGCNEILMSKTYTKDRFYRDIVLCQLPTIEAAIRNKLIIFALDDTSNDLDSLLESHPCIPVTPKGNRVKCPRDLIHPFGKVSALYLPEDERFPSDENYATPQRLLKLVNLGMQNNDITNDDIAERAESIEQLSIENTKLGSERCSALLHLLDIKLRDGDDLTDIRHTLNETKFLPTMRRPNKMPLRFAGDAMGSTITPAEAYVPELMYLVCCTRPIINVSFMGANPMTDSVRSFLQLTDKPVKIPEGIEQLRCAKEALNDADEEEYDEIRRTCSCVYKFLQDACLQNQSVSQSIVDSLSSTESILIERQFALPKQTAMGFQSDCSPYLNELPFDLQKFDFLMKTIGVRGRFEISDYVNTLSQIAQEFHDKTVDQRRIEIMINISRLLSKAIDATRTDFKTVSEDHGTIFLPSSTGVVYPSTELCFNDCPWLPDDKIMKFVHEVIPFTDAKQLGVNTKRQDSLKRNSFGIPFGQKERLTKRLKRILTGYPCGKEVLKELLQNADDAKATKIHLIKDFRYHSDKKIFEDCWKPLQGPALCVYNNSPFTKADLEGIQNLGEGSKGEDPTKTGQYGVGFNAVYHLTDAPSFISGGDEIGEVLCAFDPQCMYVPGATPDSPGRMYANLSDLRPIFTDVFECYLDDYFPIENSSMFRFPLRDRQMAANSKISNTHVTAEVLDKLIQTFRAEMFDVMLFLNNVEQVSISNIDTRSSALVDTYTVKLELSEEERDSRDNFLNYVNRVSKDIKEKRISVFEIHPREVSYTVTVCDSNNRRERWLVTQQFGFSSSASIPFSVNMAFRSGDLALLPRGGVASILSGSELSGNRQKRPYCFLPLPITSELPVHVNGHFALDHEARRNLWRDENGGYRTDWNMALLQNIITPCYIRHMRNVLEDDGLVKNDKCVVNRTADEVSQLLKTYHEQFPNTDVQDEYWHHVAKTFYNTVHKQRTRLFPCIRPVNDYEVQVKWFAAKGRGDDIAFFDSIEKTLQDHRQFTNEDADLIKEVLKATDCNLLECPLFIHENFTRLELEVKCMTPTLARMFFKTYKSLTPLCDLPHLPCPLTETPFQDLDHLRAVLKYCLLDDEFLLNLHGLPLLLTEDNNLRMFDVAKPILISSDYELVPNSQSNFVHRGLLDIFTPDMIDKSRCFAAMDIQVFSDLLSQSNIDCEDFGEVTHFRWVPNVSRFPTVEWIQKVWSFLYKELTRFIDDEETDDDTKQADIKRELSALADWNIMPARTRTEQRTPGKYGSEDNYECWLVPISNASSVIYFNKNDVVGHPLQDALSKLGLLELDVSILEKGKHGRIRGSGAVALTKYITASLNKPVAVLATLGCTMSIRTLDNVLKAKEANVVLKYFSDSMQEGHCQSATALHVLRTLPFYLTINHEIIPIIGCTVYVLPPNVPSTEMSVWKDKSGIVFTQRNDTLTTLHEHLGCSELTDTQLYTGLIFEHLEYMSEEARIVHLRYIRESTLQSATDEEKCLLLSTLRYLNFISDVDGTLKTASDFYDPENEIFLVMKNPRHFPPPPFNEFRWLRFLRLIGLVHEVTADDFVNFVEEIESNAQHNPKDHDLRKKSKILVMELFKRSDIVTEGLLERIRYIQFIAPTEVDSKWTEMYHQYSIEDGVLPYIAFDDSVSHRKEHEQIVWSSANILPQWADPLTIRDGVLTYDPDVHSSLDDYQMAIAANLNIQKQPSNQQVMDHLSNVCCHIENMLAERPVDIHRKRNLMSVMKSIYTFLKSNTVDDEDARSQLANNAFIIAEDGRRLIKPTQIVLSLYEEQQIKPYLFRAPPDLTEFYPLFENLGATTRATVQQYTMVLTGLHEACGDNKLQPNELKAAYKAVNGIFSGLGMHSENSLDVDVLYLPSEEALLISSSELVYNDEPSFTSRLVGFDKQFLVNLKECNLKAVFYGDLLRKLPKHLQCCMLSSLVNESLDSACIDRKASYGTSQLLRNRLTSPIFGDAVIRLIRHEHQGQKLSSKRLKSIKQHLKNLRVFGLETVTTFLRYEGRKIEGSESESDCFVKKIKENDEKVWCIYIADSPEMTLGPELQVHVTEVVGRMTGGLLQDSIIYLSPILTCPVQQITNILDKLRVRQDHSATQKQPTLAPPGEFIPIEDHHLLKEDFAIFEQDEYVGYELNDPTLQDALGDATYVYAIVLDIVDKEGDDPFMWHYRINVGDDRPAIVVSATDLYRFHRVEAVAREASSLFERSQSFNEQIHDEEDVVDEELTDDEDNDDYPDEVLDESTNETRYENQWQTPPETPTRDRFMSQTSSQSGQRSRTTSQGDGQHDVYISRTTSHGRDADIMEQRSRSSSQDSCYEDTHEEPYCTDDGDRGHVEYDTQDGMYSEFKPKGSVKEELDAIRERLKKQYEEQQRRRYGGEPPTKSSRPSSHAAMTEPEARPENLAKIKQYISHVLGNAYDMDEADRKKVIKRILLKWHPDKNYEQVQFATQVTQHIQSEIGRLGRGGFHADAELDPGAWWHEFTQKRAQMHRMFRERYQDSFHDRYADTHERYTQRDFNVPPSFSKKNPQPGEAKRWYRQARCDIDAAETDLNSEHPAYEWSCFKCYQAAEKGLRAAKFSIDSKKTLVTSLKVLIADLNITDAQLRQDCAFLQDMVVEPTRMCYPDSTTFPNIPHDVVDDATARDAFDATKRILQCVLDVMRGNGVEV